MLGVGGLSLSRGSFSWESMWGLTDWAGERYDSLKGPFTRACLRRAGVRDRGGTEGTGGAGGDGGTGGGQREQEGTRVTEGRVRMRGDSGDREGGRRPPARGKSPAQNPTSL